jgi:hypothetical protein
MNRARTFALLSVVACARPSAPVQEPPGESVATATPPVAAPKPVRRLMPPTAAVPEFLADDVGTRHVERTTLARFDAVALTADAPLVKIAGDHGEPGREVIVLASAGDRVRIVDAMYNLRIALYVARGDLADRVIAETPLLASPKAVATPGADGAFALPGAAPKLGKRSGDHVFVEISEPGVRVEGWLPVSAFGPIYTPSPFNENQGLLLLERNTTVKTAAGKVVAHLTVPDGWLVIMPRDEPGGSSRHVEVRTAHLRVQGRIPAKSVRPEISGFTAGGMASGTSGRMHTNFVEVPAGTLLHHTPDGEVLAVQTQADRLVLATTRQGVWHEVRAVTSWGDVPLWIRCPAFRPAAKGPNFVCTGEDDPERVEQLPQW